MSNERGPQYLETVYLFGTPDEVIASLQARVDAGVEYFFLHTMTPDPGQLQHWVDEIIPNVDVPCDRGPVRRLPSPLAAMTRARRAAGKPLRATPFVRSCTTPPSRRPGSTPGTSSWSSTPRRSRGRSRRRADHELARPWRHGAVQARRSPICVDEVEPDAAAIGAVNNVVRNDADGGWSGSTATRQGSGRASSWRWAGRSRRRRSSSRGRAARRTPSSSCVPAAAGVATGDDRQPDGRLARQALASGSRASPRRGRGHRARRIRRSPSALGSADLAVNATTVGMVDPGRNDRRVAAAGRRATVFDLVYVPAETPLLAAARARGLRAANGSEMLIQQAAIAFERWTGVERHGRRDARRPWRRCSPTRPSAPDDAARDDGRGTGRRAAVVRRDRGLSSPLDRQPGRAIRARDRGRAALSASSASASWADRQPDDAWRPLDDVALGPAVPDPGAIYTIGLNYRAPGEPAGPARTVRSSTASCRRPSRARRDARRGTARSTDNVDAECELGVVIGATASKSRRRRMATSSATRSSTTSRRATSGSTATSGCSASRCPGSARSGRGS